MASSCGTGLGLLKYSIENNSNAKREKTELALRSRSPLPAIEEISNGKPFTSQATQADRRGLLLISSGSRSSVKRRCDYDEYFPTLSPAPPDPVWPELADATEWALRGPEAFAWGDDTCSDWGLPAFIMTQRLGYRVLRLSQEEEAAVKDTRDALMVARGTNGKLVARPLSPHLQSYRWPVSMALSISHRITGVGLSVGALLMTWWLVAAATSDAAFATVQSFLGSGFGVFLLLGWSAALLLHLFQGIRHLVWDAGRGFGPLAQQEPVRIGFESRTYRTSGWILVIVTIAATLVVWVVGFLAW